MFAPESDSIIKWHGSTAYRYPAHYSYVYLLHFEQPYKHARHYLGSTCNLDSRLHLHRIGQGARLMAVISEAGIGWQVSRLWRVETCEEARQLERKYKHYRGSVQLCPICQHKPLDALALLRQGKRQFARLAMPGRRQPTGERSPMFIRGKVE